MKVDDIAEKTSKRLNKNSEKVKLINRIQWKFLKEQIESGEFNPVQIFYLGKFYRNARKFKEDRGDLLRIQKSSIQE